MKIFRTFLLLGCAITALVAAAQQPDPIIASINKAYQDYEDAKHKQSGAKGRR